LAGREHRAFLTPEAQSHLHQEGLQMLAALKFLNLADGSTENDTSRNNVPTIPNDPDEEMKRTQASWISDAAKRINPERDGKQNSQDVCRWEQSQQEEFKKWPDPN
jgi:hypothetical protein